MGAPASAAVICASCAALLADFCSPTCTPSSLESPFFYFFTPALLLLLHPFVFVMLPRQDMGNPWTAHHNRICRIGLSNIKCLYLFWFWALSCGKDCTCICVFSVIPFYVFGELPAHLIVPTLLFPLFLPVHCTAFSECCDISALWWAGVGNFITKDKAALDFLNQAWFQDWWEKQIWNQDGFRWVWNSGRNFCRDKIKQFIFYISYEIGKKSKSTKQAP